MIPRLALGFAIFAGIGRLLLPYVHSRVQVLAFVFAALAAELVGKPLAGRAPSLTGFLANAVAATLAVIAVKWWLEGISFGHPGRVLAMLLRPLG